MEEAHLRGLAFSPAEIVDSLLAYRLAERSKGVSAAIRKQIEKAHDHIETRLKASVAGGFFPRIEVLCKKVHLNDYERFLLLQA